MDAGVRTGPRLNAVNGRPFGWRMVKETVVGFPASTGPAGVKCARRNVRAACTAIVGGPDELEPPQPAVASTASAQARAVA